MPQETKRVATGFAINQKLSGLRWEDSFLVESLNSLSLQARAQALEHSTTGFDISWLLDLRYAARNVLAPWTPTPLIAQVAENTLPHRAEAPCRHLDASQLALVSDADCQLAVAPPELGFQSCK